MLAGLARIRAVTGSTVHRPPYRSAAVSAFVTLLPSGAHDVRTSLSEVLGRPDLRIAYWLPDDQRWVDEDGRRCVIDASLPGVTVVCFRAKRWPRWCSIGRRLRRSKSRRTCCLLL